MRPASGGRDRSATTGIRGNPHLLRAGRADGTARAWWEHHTVHCVVVDGLAHGPHHSERLVWGTISDIDLMRAAATGTMDQEAGEIVATEIVTIEHDEEVQQAAQLMAEHECSHLIVTDADLGRPVGVLSSLDVARALAWGARPANKVPTP